MESIAGTAAVTDEKAAEEGGGAKASPEVHLADFSDVIVGMSRVLFELARIKPFRESGLGLAEWVALSVLAKESSLSIRQLGRALGISPQRADQLETSLREAGCVAVGQSSDHARKNTITITHLGKAQLRSLDLRLKPLIAAALKDRENSLVAMKRYNRLLMRIIQTSRNLESEQRPRP